MINYYGNELTWIPVLEKVNKPVYILSAQSIENDIKTGKLKYGFRLLAQRLIANYLGINHSTVTRAYKLCEEKGLIKGIIDKGIFVSSTACIPNNLITFQKEAKIIEMGMVLPIYEVNELIKGYVNELYNYINHDLILGYSPPEGCIKHRYIASKCLKQYRIDCTTDNIRSNVGVLC